MNCYPGQRMEGETADALMEDLSDSFSYQMRESESLRPHSTQATITWLDQNYQLEEGVCLPRSTIYEHYLDFCERESIQPVNAASFGKIIRQQFPSLTTRRLGTRGQSKYHYYGLGIKSSSLYYTPDYVEKINQGNTKKTQETRKAASYHEKPSAVLPPFPEVKSMTLSDKIPIDKLKTFMVMYRAHCQRILDSVVRANFVEVESFLLHFWQVMPTHMLPVLASDVVVDLVAHCDSLLYKVISNVLITSPLQNLPDSLAGEIRKFSDLLLQWMEEALKGLPESLQEAKCKVAEGFVNGLRRQTSLTKLAQVARGELRNSNCLEHLKQDWSSLDMSVIFTQTLYAIEPYNVPKRYHQLLPMFQKQFDELLNDQTDLEHFMFWAEDMIQATVVKAHTEDHFSLKEACQAFILTWKFFTSKILQEFTMENAPSFGFLILLHMLMDDYITHILESKLEKEDEKMYYNRIQEKKKDNRTTPQIVVSSSGPVIVSTPSPVGELTPPPIPSAATINKLSSPSLSILASPPTHEATGTSSLLSLPPTEPEIPQILSLPPLPRHLSTSTSIISQTACKVNDKLTPAMDTFPRSTPSLPPLPLPTSPLPSLAHPRLHTTDNSSTDYNHSLSSNHLSANYMRQPTGGSASGHISPLPTLPLTGHQQRSTQPSNPRSELGGYPSYYPTSTSHQLQQQQQQQQTLQRTHTQMSPTAISPIHPYPSLAHHATDNIHHQQPPQHSHLRISPVPSTNQPLVNIPSISSQTFPTRTPIPHQTIGRSALSKVPPLPHPSPPSHPSLNPANNAIISDLARGRPTQPPSGGYLTNTASTRVTPSIPSLPSFTVPFASSTATSLPTSSLSHSSNPALPSIIPGIYPYTPFVGIPTQMNTPFAQTGLQMPTQPTAMAGYPYIPGVSPSLYSNTQVSSNSFTR